MVHLLQLRCHFLRGVLKVSRLELLCYHYAACLHPRSLELDFASDFAISFLLVDASPNEGYLDPRGQE